jgi:hypothetical protein
MSEFIINSDEIKQSLDEFITKQTRNYNSIVRELIRFKKEHRHDDNKKELVGSSFADQKPTNTLDQRFDSNE